MPDDSVAGAAADLPAADVAVRAQQLTKRYGNLLAVNQLDLVVPRGSVFGLIGPNGAGKSTTFAMMASLLRPTSGRIIVMGADPSKKPRTVRRRMGYMPDNLGVYDNLRVDEYIEFFAASYGIHRSEWTALVDGLLELVDLSVKRSAMVNSLSRGMKQRLSLARALVHDPELLILDEPASGLDPRARVELRELLKTLNGMGKTIVISSHILAELEEMCTDIAIMEAGKLLAAGPPREILERLGGARTVKVRFATGISETFTVADDAEQAALLRRLLVDEGRDVVEFVEHSGGLEQLFMTITEGVVQ
ncbi:MAG: ABC transporter ATP-binding protein [Actinomycetota bacterium]|nr:ABC transporter ATP-binding protein [Actinomycetota bacterium]